MTGKTNDEMSIEYPYCFNRHPESLKGLQVSTSLRALLQLPSSIIPRAKVYVDVPSPSRRVRSSHCPWHSIYGEVLVNVSKLGANASGRRRSLPYSFLSSPPYLSLSEVSDLRSTADRETTPCDREEYWTQEQASERVGPPWFEGQAWHSLEMKGIWKWEWIPPVRKLALMHLHPPTGTARAENLASLRMNFGHLIFFSYKCDSKHLCWLDLSRKFPTWYCFRWYSSECTMTEKINTVTVDRIYIC
jgi:hypothetical protein